MKTTAIMLLILTACNTKNVGKENQEAKIVAQIKTDKDVSQKSYECLNYALTTTVKDSSDYILIEMPMAIILQPDSAWTALQMNKLGEEAWSEVVADQEHYQSKALNALKKNGIDTKFFNSSKRYFKFVKSGSNATYLDRIKMKEKWGLILFNTDKDPVFWNSTMIDDAIKDIYNK